MVDLLLIERKVSDLNVYLKQIEEYKSISLSDYKAQWRVQGIVERTLHLMIETCVDVANHIIADLESRAPTSYSDTFTVLMENKIVNRSLGSRLAKMVKFRNILVYHYDEIDPAIMVSILRKSLKDFLNFKDAIVDSIKGERFRLK
ncbi:MAG: type VII toxin-antitoxin system HepT family RNase toxin [Candidatus Caldatribacteriaceae bacterium]